MTIPHNNLLSIGEASRLTGVSIRSLRYWEKMNYIPTPMRIRSGEREFRYYQPPDIETISIIKKYLDDGYTLQAAARKVADDK